MRELAESIERWRDQGDRIALATVVATRRSAPRPVGAKLIVSERGELFGSVSGGCVESDVAVQAAEVIEDGKPRLLTYGISDDQAWNVGLPCGGEIDVFVERFEGELPESSEPAVALTVLEGERAGEKSLVGPDAVEPGPSRVLELDGETVFAELLGPPPRLVVVGAIDTAEELCRAAKGLGWRTAVADPRPALATRERLPSPDELVVAWPAEALGAAGSGPRYRRRRAHARGAARRSRADLGAAERGVLRRRDRVAAHAGQAARAASRSGPRRERARTARRPGRARPGRAHSCRDGGFDPRGGAGGPRRPLGGRLAESSGPIHSTA